MSTIQIKHDGPFDIATGRTRTETNWKNKEILWSKLVEKLSVTHRTAETFAEYLTLKKTRQDEIKDVGGFVGGYLRGGRRKPGNVTHRQLLTLDLDSARADMWDAFTLQYDCASLIYSTHKHTPESPRYRLIIPLDRPVFSDEYVAIARRIAGDIDIESFDNTGFQPSRLMYWPSSSKDGSFEFQHQDGPWLNADDVLATYRDWQDSSEWPVSIRNSEAIQRSMKKQGDPLEKPGIVGAFCRTHNIHEAIEKFLGDVYEPCDLEDRYTYKEGSTAAGLVVYDDKYAYSHHGTDPISGKLCNSFDLVRIHKYGLKDEDARDGTPGNKLPSYTEMTSFATKDPDVRRMLGQDRLAAAMEDFADDIDLTGDEQNEETSKEPVSDEWLTEMEVDKQGRNLSTINNVLLILRNDPKLKGRIGYSVFENREIVLKNLPWRILTRNTRYLTDNIDDAGLRHYLEKYYGISSSPKIQDALDICVHENSFHPIKDFILAAKWDGKPRIDALLIDYMGAEDNLYTRTVMRKALVACVARVFEPGTKFDNMLIQIGPQGCGKSTILNLLGGEWFSDSFSFKMIGNKQAEEQLQGSWLMEVPELDGMSKADTEAAKSFLSRREDRYRVAYGKRLAFFPRQCVPFGTSNKDTPLRDNSGNRRFWPVKVAINQPTKNVFTDLTILEVHQIWAEAYILYLNKEPLYLNKEVRELAEQQQAEHTERDDREGLIEEYLETLLPEGWEDMDLWARREYLKGDSEMKEKGTIRRTRVCAAEIWCEILGGTQKEMTRYNTMDVHNIMRKIDGWHLHKTKAKVKGYGVQRAYYRNGEEDQQRLPSGRLSATVIDDEDLI